MSIVDIARPNGWSSRAWCISTSNSMRPGPEGKVNSLVHRACGELGITHIESLLARFLYVRQAYAGKSPETAPAHLFLIFRNFA